MEIALHINLYRVATGGETGIEKIVKAKTTAVCVLEEIKNHEYATFQ